MQSQIELSSEQKDILNASGNLLITGGPGSGKTTIAILKAAKLVEKFQLSSQQILFLSFARATVSRVTEVLTQDSFLTEKTINSIDVDTYHAFFWRIIKTHGYLIGLPRTLSVLPPPEEAVALSKIRTGYGKSNQLSDDQKEKKIREEREEQRRIAFEEGKICFDLFADFSYQLIKGSTKIRHLVSLAFPTIILDEFQDTNSGQWEVVKELGKNSKLVVLADPEQSIYDFIGADPARIDHFRKYVQPEEFNLSSKNYRSIGTDIIEFGNDVLHEKVCTPSQYNDVKIIEYWAQPNPAFKALKRQVYSAIKRLKKHKSNHWSLLVLTPTKKLTMQVSERLNSSSPPIRHSVTIDMAGAILATEIFAFILQQKSSDNHLGEFLNLLSNFYRGKSGDSPTKTGMKEAQKIENIVENLLRNNNDLSKLRKNSIIHSISNTYEMCRSIKLTGNPNKDLLKLKDLFKESNCKRLQEVAKASKNIKILSRGTQLRGALSSQWRETGSYTDALEIFRRCNVQAHFARSQKIQTGIVLMNMHKAKGHQFDEVIIFEGWPLRSNDQITSNHDRIVQGNITKNVSPNARQNLYVSITRAKSRTTILTPKGNRCVLF
ncbi:MAG: ATP-dependent helicase [Bacteroidetes bacterium]|nr:ATP-dependent helicase [Bacteroidota bacterium]